MEPLDVAAEQFRALRNKLTPDFLKTVVSEQDVRMKIIDPMFVTVLGWPEADIHLEANAGSGFIDYRHTINELNRLITEAKRTSRAFAIDPTRSGRAFKLNGPVFTGVQGDCAMLGNLR